MDRVTLAAMGVELRARREARGITRSALAEAVGSRPVIVGRWERGEAVPTPEQAQVLVRVLDLPPGEAAGWEAAARAGVMAGEEPPPGERRIKPRRRTAAWWPAVRSALGRGRPGGESGGPGADAAYRSYLDDPAEQRRYTVRWVLTMAALAALAIALVWALGELADGWRALLDLLRSRPATGGPAGALSLLGAL
jgi:transcriptional regulator with XRE-family HTH domain